MSKTKELFIESTMVCPMCGTRYDNKDDITCIRLFGICRTCDRSEYYK